MIIGMPTGSGICIKHEAEIRAANKAVRIMFVPDFCDFIIYLFSLPKFFIRLTECVLVVKAIDVVCL